MFYFLTILLPSVHGISHTPSIESKFRTDAPTKYVSVIQMIFFPYAMYNNKMLTTNPFHATHRLIFSPPNRGTSLINITDDLNDMAIGGTAERGVEGGRNADTPSLLDCKSELKAPGIDEEQKPDVVR